MACVMLIQNGLYSLRTGKYQRLSMMFFYQTPIAVTLWEFFLIIKFSVFYLLLRSETLYLLEH